MTISNNRAWFNYQEISQYSEDNGDIISVSDIARLISDETIQPSIYFQSLVTVRKITIKTVPLAVALDNNDALIRANLDMLNNDAVFPDALIQHAVPINDEIIRVRGLWDTLPQGVIKNYHESLYSKLNGFSEPQRSLYDVRGIILIKGSDMYQVQSPVNIAESVKMLESIKLELGEDVNPLVDNHICKLTRAMNQVNNGDHIYKLMPCTCMPTSAIPVVKREIFLRLFNKRNKGKPLKTTTKTTNAMGKMIYDLMIIHYGKDVADAPRNHLKDGGVIADDFKNKTLKPPCGVTVGKWINNAIM